MPAFFRISGAFFLDCLALCRDSWRRCPQPIADPQAIAEPSSSSRSGDCKRRALEKLLDGGLPCVYSPNARGEGKDIVIEV
jgi:hypothetical protein